MQRKLEAYDEMVLRIGSLATQGKDGTEVTLMENALRKLHDRAFDKTNPDFKSLKLLNEIYRSSSQTADELRAKAFKLVSEYKEECTARIRECEAKRMRYRDPIPHPEDIILYRDCTFKIVGPITEEEHRDLQVVIERRNIMERVVRDCEERMNEPGIREIIVDLQADWDATTGSLPPRYRKPFPGKV